MKWDNFEESSKELPEISVAKAIDGFSEATRQLADININPLSDMERINSKIRSTFQFNTYLVSNNLPDYSFKIFQFGYGITIYPVSLIMSVSILSELQKAQKGPFQQVTIIGDEDELNLMLQLIFGSERFKDIVSGVMKIARQKTDF